ncbi:MAG: hypothetical protein OEM20_06285 [Gammaproteobacteria bacterium]|nr:hypothetical protein [Gammaproteobacteria bacterium]
MRYPDVAAAVEGVPGPYGPFPVIEQVIDGVSRQVFRSLPDSLARIASGKAFRKQIRSEFIELLGL